MNLNNMKLKFRSSQAQYNAALQNIKSLQAGTKSTVTTLVMANKNLSRTTINFSNGWSDIIIKCKKRRACGRNCADGRNRNDACSWYECIEVRVDVGENDIVKVNIGDSADVKVEAYNN